MQLSQSTISNIQGSIFSVKHRRNDLRGYFWKFGLPHFFITINLADIHNQLLYMLAKNQIDLNIFENKMAFERAKILTSNPVLHSQFFDIYINAFIKDLLNYNKQTKLGLLGEITHYYGMIETQGLGSLHFHGFFWLKTYCQLDEYRKFFTSDIFLQDFIKYIDSVISCEMPNFQQVTQNIYHPCSIIPTYLQQFKSNQYDIDINAEYNQDLFAVLKKTNIHVCNPNCYKSNGACRYGFGKGGKHLEHETFISKSGKIHHKRNHAYLNNYNPQIAVTLRCNHDIQFFCPLENDSALKALFYITMYITKHPISSYNYYAIAMKAFEKLKTDFKDEGVDSINLTKKLISNMYNLLATLTEYSGPQIAHLIFNYGRFGTHYCSDMIIPFNFYPFYQYIERFEKNKQENQLIPVVYCNYMIKNPDLTLDYFLRSVELDKICLYKFKSKYKVTQIKNANKKFYLMHPNHPNQNKCISELKTEYVVSYLGPTKPLSTDLEKQELYAKIMLGIFKPWRKYEDLLENFSCFADAFKNFVSIQENNWIKEVILNDDLLKRGQLAVEAEHKNDNINFKDSSESINTYSDDEIISVNNFNSSLNPKKIIEAIWVDEAYNILKNKLDKHKQEISNVAKSSLDCVRFENINPKLYRRWLLDYKAKLSFNLDNRILSNDYSPPKIKKREGDLKLVIQKIDYSALISETLDKFQLNIEQIPNFLLFVNKLLNNKPSTQILCNLTGEGGTGKTLLIDALQYFFEKTNNLHKLSLTATTGIAATNINGNTIHSMVALSFYNKHLPHLNISSKNKLELEKRFQNVEFLVIEENSMNGKYNLNIISKMLMIAKNNDSLFGEISILFVGDFFQLQPVKQVALFKQSNIEKCSNYNKKFIKAEISKHFSC